MHETAQRTLAASPPDAPGAQLEHAIVQAVAYADIFDYPLTAAEIQRYLVGIVATPAAVADALAGAPFVTSRLAAREGFFTLRGREEIVATRLARQRTSETLWRPAVRYGGLIASLPFVQMVAVTGELAVDNVRPTSDIDYFIVTEPGRLWLCRLLVIGVVRVAALRGVTVCPNYLVSERALTIQERNLYTAHELVQMTPLAGHAVYRRMRELNGWVADYLPNADGPPQAHAVTPRWRPLRRLAQGVLRSRAGDRIERWEMRRKVRKLAPHGVDRPEVSFAPDWCKGHVSGHEGRILEAFRARWQAIGEGAT